MVISSTLYGMWTSCRLVLCVCVRMYDGSSFVFDKPKNMKNYYDLL